jgi:hypothetical protein
MYTKRLGLRLATGFAAVIGVVALTSMMTTPAGAVPVPCGTIATFGDWAGATDGCFDADKLYTLLDTDIDAGTAVTFANFADTTHILIQHLDLDGPIDLFLDYTIESTDPDRHIILVTVDSDVSGTGVGTTISKDILNSIGGTIDTIVSADGAPDSTGPISEDFLEINETIHIVADSHVSSISNDFTQSVPAPEPLTLALFATGLLALGIKLRRSGV